MENFIYSINVTFPIFLVMVIGYFLKQIGFKICIVLCACQYRVFLADLGWREAVFKGSDYAGSFCAGIVPQQCGGDGTCLYPEYLWNLGDGAAYDRQCGAAL